MAIKYAQKKIHIFTEECVSDGTLTRGMGVTLKSINTDGEKVVGLKASVTDEDFGVVLNDATSGQRVSILRLGTDYVLAGGALAINSRITAGTDGKFVAANPGPASVQPIAGLSQEVGADGKMAFASICCGFGLQSVNPSDT